MTPLTRTHRLQPYTLAFVLQLSSQSQHSTNTTRKQIYQTCTELPWCCTQCINSPISRMPGGKRNGSTQQRRSCERSMPCTTKDSRMMRHATLQVVLLMWQRFGIDCSIVRN